MIFEIDADALRCIAFTHIDNKGVVRHFNIDKIQARTKNHPVFDIDISRSFAKWVLRHNGLEQHRLDRLLRVEGEFDPVIYVQFADGTYVLVDGSHRYAAAYLQKRKIIKGKCMSFLEWQDCLLKLPNIPNPHDWLKGSSYIP